MGVTVNPDRLALLDRKDRKAHAEQTELLALTVRMVWALRAPILPLTAR
jgi:hypothetical protein